MDRKKIPRLMETNHNGTNPQAKKDSSDPQNYRPISLKAYDMTWKYGVMKGRLPQFIEGFLSNRKFRVHVDTIFSSVRNQEEGVPQGSILSVTLFNMKINNITKELPSRVDGSLYVDDFMICCKLKYIHTIE